MDRNYIYSNIATTMTTHTHTDHQYESVFITRDNYTTDTDLKSKITNVIHKTAELILTKQSTDDKEYFILDAYNFLQDFSLRNYNYLFFIENNYIIGYIKGEINYSNKEKQFIILHAVEIAKPYRGKRICEQMISRHIQETENIEKIQYYYLFSIDSAYSCRCYITGFAKNSYHCYGYVHDNQRQNRPIADIEMFAKDLCQNEPYQFRLFFFKEKINLHKRTTIFIHPTNASEHAEQIDKFSMSDKNNFNDIKIYESPNTNIKEYDDITDDVINQYKIVDILNTHPNSVKFYGAKQINEKLYLILESLTEKITQINGLILVLQFIYPLITINDNDYMLNDINDDTYKIKDGNIKLCNFESVKKINSHHMYEFTKNICNYILEKIRTHKFDINTNPVVNILKIGSDEKNRMSLRQLYAGLSYIFKSKYVPSGVNTTYYYFTCDHAEGKDIGLKHKVIKKKDKCIVISNGLVRDTEIIDKLIYMGHNLHEYSDYEQILNIFYVTTLFVDNFTNNPVANVENRVLIDNIYNVNPNTKHIVLCDDHEFKECMINRIGLYKDVQKN